MTSATAAPAARPRSKIRLELSREDWIMRTLTVGAGVFLVIFVVLPLLEVIFRSFQNKDGQFIGLANYQTYFSTPALAGSLINSLFVSSISTVVTVTLAFVFAYALTRTCMPGRGIFRTLAMLPMLAPSLLYGIAFIYLFGNKGLFTTGFFDFFRVNFGFHPAIDIDLYNAPTGIILAEIFYLFPQALIILVISLGLADARLYEASVALRASSWRTFFTVTLPGAKYGLISAAFVCFTLVMTDFGIPKVLSGNFNVLATDIYRQVVGQQNFVMGSTVAVLLLTPVVFGFAIDRMAQRRQFTMLNARAVPLDPRPNRRVDWALFGFCLVIVSAILLVIGTALLASLVNVWPYDLSLSLRHYNFRVTAGGGLNVYWNSLVMAALTAVFGTIIVFCSAYFIEKAKGFRIARSGLYFLSTLPVALPGLVLGLAYIFFFNSRANPLNGLYGTMGILVLCTIVHFYTVAFFTATAALKQIDPEFEAVAASLSVPFYRTFWRVTMPMALPAILEIAMYYFVNAMTTVSAVIFLYSASLKLAAVAIVNMDDAGDTAPAAAMSMLVFFTCVGVRVVYGLATRRLRRRTQAWRMPAPN